MELKEYIVTLQKGIDYDQFWDQIENESDEDGFVPTRRVDIHNNRDGSTRICHYTLTDEEAEQLRADPRVLGVEIPIESYPNHIRLTGAFQQDAGIYDQTITTVLNYSSSFVRGTTTARNQKNWGLTRTISGDDPYNQTTTLQTLNGFSYSLAGEGVDVVIVDSGIQADHPEFHDHLGNSRVVQLDWYTATSYSGTLTAMPTGHYTDYHGHGTHVAGITAGKTFGWARKAKIYAIKLEGLEGSTDPNTGIPFSDAMDMIRIWHTNKPIETSGPAKGYKRPTVVNNSWGSYALYLDTDISAIWYRDRRWSYNFSGANIELAPASGTLMRSDPVYRLQNFGIPNYTTISGGTTYYAASGPQYASTITDIEELIDAGVHVVNAAGNENCIKDTFYHVSNERTNADLTYMTTYVDIFGLDPYPHRIGLADGDSTRNATIVVGSVDSAFNGVKEQISDFSNTGPGVDIYAPGSNIMSSVSTTNVFSSTNYSTNTSFRQASIGGTSMAAPQVTGVLATLLEMKPGMTPLEAKNYLLTFCNKTNSSTAPTVNFFESTTPVAIGQTITVDISAGTAGSPYYYTATVNDRNGTQTNAANPNISMLVGDTIEITNNILSNSGYRSFLQYRPITGATAQVGSGGNSPSISSSSTSRGTFLCWTTDNNNTASGQGSFAGTPTTTWTPKYPGQYYITSQSYASSGCFMIVTVSHHDDYDDTRSIQMTQTYGTAQGSRGVLYQPYSKPFAKVSNTNVTGVDVQYLVIGGGGAGGLDGNDSGGGGAGGYRCNVPGESSGGGFQAEPAFNAVRGKLYPVTIGAGGTWSGYTGDPSIAKGTHSRFGPILSEGGAFGGAGESGTVALSAPARRGGSGGGAGDPLTDEGGIAFDGLNAQTWPPQGYKGGAYLSDAGGGGGAGQPGFNGNTTSFQAHGGDGIASSITGSSVYRAGGGGGGTDTATYGVGGLGGGGKGGTTTGTGSAGTANTGSGGGGYGSTGLTGSNGGSGVVILRYPTASPAIVDVDGTLTMSSATVGADTVTTITAGTGRVRWGTSSPITDYKFASTNATTAFSITRPTYNLGDEIYIHVTWEQNATGIVVPPTGFTQIYKANNAGDVSTGPTSCWAVWRCTDPDSLGASISVSNSSTLGGGAAVAFSTPYTYDSVPYFIGVSTGRTVYTASNGVPVALDTQTTNTSYNYNSSTSDTLIFVGALDMSTEQQTAMSQSGMDFYDDYIYTEGAVAGRGAFIGYAQNILTTRSVTLPTPLSNGYYGTVFRFTA